MKKASWLMLLTLPLLLGANLRDPTRPPDYKNPSTSSTSLDQMQLTAIFVYPTYQIAIIDGQVLKVGGHVGEYTITTINLNAVELQGPQGDRETLQLATTVKQQRS